MVPNAIRARKMQQNKSGWPHRTDPAQAIRKNLRRYNATELEFCTRGPRTELAGALEGAVQRVARRMTRPQVPATH